MVTAQLIPPSVLSPEDVARGTVFAIEGSTHHGRRLELQSSRILVGSSPGCTLRLVARGVAPHHCLIIRGRERTVFRAINGRLLHNGKATGSGVLHPGDLLAIGPVTLRFAPDSNRNGDDGSDVEHRFSERGDHAFNQCDVGHASKSQAGGKVSGWNAATSTAESEADEASECAGRLTLASDSGPNEIPSPQVTVETVWSPCGVVEWHFCLPDGRDHELADFDVPSAGETANLAAIEGALSRLESLADRFAQSLSSVSRLESYLVRLADRVDELAHGSTEPRSFTASNPLITEESTKEHGEMPPAASYSDQEVVDEARQSASVGLQIDREAVPDAAIAEEQPCPTDLISMIRGKDSSKYPEGAGDDTPQSCGVSLTVQGGLRDGEGDAGWFGSESRVLCTSQDKGPVDEQTRQEAQCGESGTQDPASAQADQATYLSEQAGLSADKRSENGRVWSHETSCSPHGQSESGDHEQAVREYMRELLPRLRVASGRGETGTSVENAETLSQGTTSGEKSPMKTRRPPPTNTLTRSRGSRKRPVAPEKHVNFAAMRELANLASQAAIDRYARAKLHQAQRGKAVVVLTAVGAAAVILGLDWLWGVSALGKIALFVSILVALVYGIQYAILAGKLIVNPRGQLQLAERRIGREMRKLMPSDKPLVPGG